MQRAAAQSHSLDAVRAHYRRLAPSYDRKANATCKTAYRELVTRVFADAKSVLELGAGSSPLVAELPAARRVACDLSTDMFGANETSSQGLTRVVADAQRLPFAEESFDGVFCINLLEHTPDPGAVVRESARVLQPGGRFLAVTPNGDLEWLLGALERLHLKLPEGPHRFLGSRGLAGLASNSMRVIEQRRFLALPIGPWSFARQVDRIAARGISAGLFLYAIMERPEKLSVIATRIG